MRRGTILPGLVMAGLLSLGACSSGDDPFSTVDMTKRLVDRYKQARQPAPPVGSPAARLALETKFALETADPGARLATVTFEQLGIASVLRIIETNRAHLTWAAYSTADRRYLVTKQGFITATRRLTRDLMSADVDEVAALVTAQREGAALYTQRYLDGNHKIVEATYSCKVTRGYDQSVPLPDRTVPVLQMFSSCISEERQFVDLFLVDPSGKVVESRQWVGPGLGFAVMTHLR
jgi:hypothetical protein